MTIARPTTNEHAPYAITYVDATATALAAQGLDSVIALLAIQPSQLRTLLGNAPTSIAHVAYAPGKWTLAESLLHIADSERVFSYRLLRVARGDLTPLASFDQDAWVPNSRTGSRTVAVRQVGSQCRYVHWSGSLPVTSRTTSSSQTIGTSGTPATADEPRLPN